MTRFIGTGFIYTRTLLLVSLLLVMLPAPAQSQTPVQQSPDSYMKLYSVEGSFENVRDDVELAITGNGMVVNNVSHIGNMLARTGKDLGAKKKIFDQAEALEFCSSRISRNMMEADPHNIVFCPYIIAVYTLPTDKNKVYVAFRRPVPVGDKTSQDSLKAVEKLLLSIVDEVVN